jgi:hypothetical protein
VNETECNQVADAIESVFIAESIRYLADSRAELAPSVNDECEFQGGAA